MRTLRGSSIGSLLLLAACASGPRATPDQPAAAHQPAPISAEAAAVFARADQAGPGAAVVLDFESMRELGFLSANHEKSDHAMADMLVNLLPAMGDSAAEAAPFARAAVLMGLVRDWADWPIAHRAAVIVPGVLPQMDPSAILQDGLVVVAVDSGEAANAELLRGLTALIRAGAGASSPAQIKAEGNLICASAPNMPDRICARAGAGYIALGSQKTLSGLTAPQAGAALPTAAGALVRLKVELPSVGKAQIVAAGHSSVAVKASIEAENPMMVMQMEQMANEFLQRLDARRADSRTRVAEALAETQRTLAADAEAPQSLKDTAAKMTLDQLLDRNGVYQSLRSSVKVVRADNKLDAEMEVPARLIHDVTHGGSMTTAMMGMGIAAAVAIPNFMKFQCRSKTSEARANLKAYYTSQRAFQMEKDRWGKSFEETGFQPEKGRRYTYCMKGQCLPCDREGCKAGDPANNPCTEIVGRDTGGAPMGCAYGEVTPGKVDVWAIGASGELENVRPGCD